jgi:DNA repair exonuclease SbcCD ATPase subunit
VPRSKDTIEEIDEIAKDTLEEPEDPLNPKKGTKPKKGSPEPKGQKPKPKAKPDFDPSEPEDELEEDMKELDELVKTIKVKITKITRTKRSLKIIKKTIRDRKKKPKRPVTPLDPSALIDEEVEEKELDDQLRVLIEEMAEDIIDVKRKTKLLKRKKRRISVEKKIKLIFSLKKRVSVSEIVEKRKIIDEKKALIKQKRREILERKKQAKLIHRRIKEIRDERRKVKDSGLRRTITERIEQEKKTLDELAELVKKLQEFIEHEEEELEEVTEDLMSIEEFKKRRRRCRHEETVPEIVSKTDEQEEVEITRRVTELRPALAQRRRELEMSIGEVNRMVGQAEEIRQLLESLSPDKTVEREENTEVLARMRQRIEQTRSVYLVNLQQVERDQEEFDRLEERLYVIREIRRRVARVDFSQRPIALTSRTLWDERALSTLEALC